MTTVGLQLMGELGGCDGSLLADVSAVRAAMREAAAQARVEILNEFYHLFSPTGVSGVLCIAESHISIHTWPEQGYAAVDVFTCGEQAVPRRALEVLAAAFKARHVEITEITRGIPQAAGGFQACVAPAHSLVSLK